MIGVEEVRVRAAAQVQRRRAAWAAGLVLDEPATGDALAVPLAPPTEREMLTDEGAAEAWTREWRSFVAPDGVEVEWVVRSWRSIGRQRVPVRLRARDAGAVAVLAGGQQRKEWERITARVGELVGCLGASDALAGAVKRHCARLAGFDDVEFAQVVAVAAWIVEHPVTGYRPRQVPVRGVDSKWLGRHRSMVRDLVGAVTGSGDLGLVDADPLVRVRILDEGPARGWPLDFASSPGQLSTLQLAPSAVMVFENLESVLAMPPLPGAVVVHGAGFAVDAVARLPWVRRVPVLYWGDLDSHGFAILHRLRSLHPDVRSVLMDESTLLAHRDLWVPEPAPTRGDFPTLTDSERSALHRIRAEGDVRLEQERIGWAEALTRLRASWQELTTGAEGGAAVRGELVEGEAAADGGAGA